MSGSLAEARAAVERGDWQPALDLLDRCGSSAETAEGLELRAMAEYGVGRLERCVAAWEELHSLFVASGDRAEAARAAAMVALHLLIDTGLMAPVRGWLRRAEQLLKGLDEVPAHAMIPAVRTYERFMCGDMEAVREQSARAVELGGRLDVNPAVVIGRVASARVRIFDGEVAEGLAQLDEVGALLMSGGADPLTTGIMYCELICAAQTLALHDRASEWTDVMERWRHGAAFGGVNGRCRVHRAELLRMSGPCDAAEEEALLACDELRPWMRREFGWPLVELGNIRLRKGDLDGAAEAFRAAHDHAWSPQPGLSRLRLEQGDVEAAASLIEDAIAHPLNIPSKELPPFGDLRLAPLLDAQAEIAVVAGDVDAARRAAEGLRSIADAYASRPLAASAVLAEGRAALVAGEIDDAIDRCATAVAEWADLDAPFETAVARMALADARMAEGNDEAARMEWEAARSAFEAFGAARWADRARERLEGLLPGAAGLTVAGSGRPEAASFACAGDTRTVDFAGSTAHLRDLKGLRYIARLLAEPGREFHSLDLVAVESGAVPAPAAASVADDELVEVTEGTGAGIAAIDDEAREAYRRRLAEVEEDIEEATRLNDLGRVELAERDRAYLVAELARATGLGGRHRTVGGSAERARTSVTRTIRYSLDRLAEHHPPAASHLQRCVRTGTYCAYEPDRLAPVEWRV